MAALANHMDITTLTSALRIIVPAGQVVIEEGQPFAGVLLLEAGELEVLKRGVRIAQIYEPGAVLGEMSWLLATLPTATVRTRTPATFRQVANPDVFFREHPDAAIHLATILARRVDSLNRYLVEIKNQFKDQAGHLGIIDEVLDALMQKHPRAIPRRDAGD